MNPFDHFIKSRFFNLTVDRIIFKRFSILFIIVIFNLFLLQCTSSPMHGVLYNNTKHHVFPLSSGVRQLTSHSILTSGKSCSVGSSILFSFFYYGGGASIEEAAQNGSISKIAVVDRESISLIYGIFYQECIIVWGE
ncbi:TRL domain-containing protein [Leptospira sp. GIMC2001]|uniref:TRL domain-containing protein n=1 Tax=Leptospira sp. GIMC2001 TaxID=1513297 RepID=UPI002349A3AF|nr:TRL domain-containing protein [Leptospira sp. GIMC2001]WCL47762.1 hypothetical protein O4O04_00460 [Leptospira sp. GIMC2001]